MYTYSINNNPQPYIGDPSLCYQSIDWTHNLYPINFHMPQKLVANALHITTLHVRECVWHLLSASKHQMSITSDEPTRPMHAQKRIKLSHQLRYLYIDIYMHLINWWTHHNERWRKGQGGNGDRLIYIYYVAAIAFLYIRWRHLFGCSSYAQWCGFGSSWVESLAVWMTLSKYIEWIIPKWIAGKASLMHIGIKGASSRPKRWRSWRQQKCAPSKYIYIYIWSHTDMCRKQNIIKQLQVNH